MEYGPISSDSAWVVVCVELAARSAKAEYREQQVGNPKRGPATGDSAAGKWGTRNEVPPVVTQLHAASCEALAPGGITLRCSGPSARPRRRAVSELR